MNIGLIIIGDEILSGKRQDKHMARAIELLAERGMALDWVQYLGDDRPRIVAQLRQAFASGDLVLCCGGIGATPDDHTRQAAAEALARPLTLHPEARELIWARIQEMSPAEALSLEDPDVQRRLQMGEFPAGADIIPNPYNKIPGFSVGTVFFMPGFPVMAHPMMAWILDTRFAHLHGAQGLRERSLIVPGAMESRLTPLMEDIERRFAGVKVFSLPSVDHPQWGRHIELGVKGEAELMGAAYAALKQGLLAQGFDISTELVR